MSSKLTNSVRNTLRGNIVEDIVGMIEKYATFHFKNTKIYKFYKKMMKKDEPNEMYKKYFYYIFKNEDYSYEDIANIAKLMIKIDLSLEESRTSREETVISNDQIYKYIILLKLAALTTYVPYNAYEKLFEIADKLKDETYFFSVEFVEIKSILFIKDYLHIGIHNLDNIISNYCDYKLCKCIEDDKYIEIMNNKNNEIEGMEKLMKQINHDNPLQDPTNNLRMLLIIENKYWNFDVELFSHQRIGILKPYSYNYISYIKYIDENIDESVDNDNLKSSNVNKKLQRSTQKNFKQTRYNKNLKHCNNFKNNSQNKHSRCNLKQPK